MHCRRTRRTLFDIVGITYAHLVNENQTRIRIASRPMQAHTTHTSKLPPKRELLCINNTHRCGDLRGPVKLVQRRQQQLQQSHLSILSLFFFSFFIRLVRVLRFTGDVFIELHATLFHVLRIATEFLHLIFRFVGFFADIWSHAHTANHLFILFTVHRLCHCDIVVVRRSNIVDFNSNIRITFRLQ